MDDFKKLLSKEAVFESADRWVNSKIRSMSVVDQLQTRSKRVLIKDDTLREGSNTPGVIVKEADKVRVALKMQQLGVEEIEAGYGGIDENLNFMKLLKREGCTMRLGSHTVLWADDHRREVDRSLEAGADVINFVGMVGQLTAQAVHPHLSVEQIMEKIDDAVRYTKAQGAISAIGLPSDDLDTLLASAKIAGEAGADRLYLYDTRGWYTPDTMRFLVSLLKDTVGPSCEIAVHCHDDFGLAVINAIESVRAGATIVDVTINRLGHRAGNTDFTQAVLAFESLYGINTGIDVAQLWELTHLVEETFGFPIPKNAPHIGENCYMYGGFHINAMLDNKWYLWENVRAETIGANRQLFFGATALHKGQSSPITKKIAKMGLQATDEQFDRIMDGLRDALKTKKSVSDSEMESIINGVLL